jgi:arabinose-5-phosphate isomerase
MKETILTTARKALAIETEAVQTLETYLDPLFAKAVEAIYQTKGKLIVTGIGKSAIIAQKIVATCNSTGTPAIYLHAADAIHGDSGMISSDDIVLIISKSGESPEIKNLVQLIQHFGNPIIAMVGNMNSFLAKSGQFIINTTVHQEACINNLAPTSSTTAQMVMGDLVAVSLMQLRGFESKDFARYHPGGNLGKQLTLTAGIIAESNLKPSVQLTTSLKEVITTISKNRLGATAVIDSNNKILGIITDGDIRRMLETHNQFQDLTAKDIYHDNPITIAADTLAIEAAKWMEQKDISQIIVVDKEQYKGIIHIHDLMKEGII